MLLLLRHCAHAWHHLTTHKCKDVCHLSYSALRLHDMAHGDRHSGRSQLQGSIASTIANFRLVLSIPSNLLCLKIRSTGGKVVCAWPSLSDPVVCRAGDSHDCCDEEAESFVSKTGQQLLVLFAMNATKTMPPRVQCLASVTLPLVFWFSFVLDIKVVFPLPFLHICFSALPPLKRSLILSYIRENVAPWEISI